MLLAVVPASAEWSHRSDFSLRFDDRSDRPSRSQYRLRMQPQLELSRHWSMHGFIATGDRYDNAWNTIDENDDVLYVRRLFARYAVEGSKIEFGIIPPFKGRVSSIGLSKEGWIRGARGVLDVGSGQLELVVGNLNDLTARSATERDFKLNYFEFEYSSRLKGGWSFELGAEEFFEDRFLRGELRHQREGKPAFAAELIRNVSTDSTKVVLSAATTLERPGGSIRWFSFYSYAGEGFGQRAELSEDFLEFGHALSSQLKGRLLDSEKTHWFARVELYEEISRFMVGLEFTLN